MVLFQLVVKCSWWCDFFNQSNDYTSFYNDCINFCVIITDAIKFCVIIEDALKFCVSNHAFYFETVEIEKEFLY